MNLLDISSSSCVKECAYKDAVERRGVRQVLNVYLAYKILETTVSAKEGIIIMQTVTMPRTLHVSTGGWWEV
jgi:hypothetical protein